MLGPQVRWSHDVLQQAVPEAASWLHLPTSEVCLESRRLRCPVPKHALPPCGPLLISILAGRKEMISLTILRLCCFVGM